MTLSNSHWGAFRAEAQDGRVSLTPFERDRDPSPVLRGLAELYDSPLRVRRPAIRRSWLEHGPGANPQGRGREPFVEVEWDEALDLLAAELTRVRAEHGNTAIFAGSYGWASAGRFHHAKTQLKRFINLFGGATDQVNNYSYGAAMVLLPHILGSNEVLTGQATSWRSIAEDTELMLAFGGTPWKNAQIESGGCGDHTLRHWTAAAAERGMRLVNVSPIRDDVGDWQKGEWWPIRPGTDTALILALAHTLVVEDLHDRHFLATHCVGFETFAQHLIEGRPGGFGADWAASITGIDAEEIRSLARAMVRQRTMIALSWSIQRADFGEQSYWAAIALAAMLGQIGLPGGGIGFGYGATNGIGSTGRRVSAVNLKAPPNPAKSTIPVARIADLLLNPGAELRYNGREITLPETRLIYWAGGNPFHHHQDLNRLVRAFQRPDTIVVHEISWTSTARFSDIVLPATTTLERNDIASNSRDRFMTVMRQVVPPFAGARDDFAIFTDLARRLGFAEAFTEGRDEMAWLAHLYEEARAANVPRGVTLPPFDAFWSSGLVELPEEETPHVAMAEFRADPERHPLATPSGRIEIASATIAGFGLEDCPGHPTWIAPREWLGAPLAERLPLHLISNQPRTRLHSQLDMLGEARDSKIDGREPLRMNPADAAERGLADGDVVRVYNDRGACLAGLLTSAAIRPGVVQMATGAWYDPVDGGGSLDVHGNVNVLTHDLGTSALSCAPAAQSVLVEVERYTGELPEVRVSRPPEFVPRGLG
ncbi:molybdopterin-dependent oxidoreductase [Acuticoccus mangrovi]|uniref:Molybdopterin-dependent oxidoreductase n=1 Tax=Acuticoccus mangrovi TaxID=2796142 RepID=A0A934MJ73_9HYPH|nr:molybdopterin-dependent oxidoreductase [Acuticoccus mangrovi]MBJ3778615.1 molybdopterin-dependent oxidoreductase [Acuticoccus mangrovi]